MNKLRKETGKYLALLLLATILTLSVTLIYRIYADYVSDKQYTATKLEKIRKKLGYISKNKKKIKTTYTAYKNNRFHNKLYLNKSNPVKELVAHVNHINKTSCKLGGYEPAKRAAESVAVSIKYHTSCQYSDLYNLLFVLENSRPLVDINELKISRPRRNPDNNIMDAEFVVKGYIKG